MRRLSDIAALVLERLYAPNQFSIAERDAYIRARHEIGVGITELARQFAISPQRVWQIVNGRRR